MSKKSKHTPALCWMVVRIHATTRDISVICDLTGLEKKDVGDILRKYKNKLDPLIPIHDPLLRLSLLTPPDEDEDVEGLRKAKIEFMKAVVQRRPDLYLPDILLHMQSTVAKPCYSPADLCRALVEDDVEYHMIKEVAERTNEAQRKQYYSELETYEVSHLVFVSTSLQVSKGVEEEIISFAHINEDGEPIKNKWNVMAAMTLQGIFHTRVFKGKDDDDANFASFIGEVISKMRNYPEKHSVLVVDDSNGRADELLEIIEENGQKLLCLPPYSPDLNPLERAFLEVKRRLRVKNEQICSLICSRNGYKQLQLTMEFLEVINSLDRNTIQG